MFRTHTFPKLISLFTAASLASASLGGCATDEGTAPGAAVDGVAIVDHQVEGRVVRFALDAPLDPSVLAGATATLSAVGPDPVTDAITRRELAASARLEDDGYTLALEVTERLSDASSYSARLVAAGGAVTELGEFDGAPAPAARTNNKFEVATISPQDGQGLFPAEAELKAKVPRDQEYVKVTFKGGTIDCKNLIKGTDGIRVYATKAPQDGHDMYEVVGSDWGEYRGKIETCSEGTNTLYFKLPGRLYGGADYKIRVKAKDKSGDVTPVVVTKFRTENPGLRVKITRVAHDMSSKCDKNNPFSSGYEPRCDSYLVYASAWLEPKGTDDYTEQGDSGRMPSSGDWANWTAGQIKYPNVYWMDTKKPILDDAMLIIQGFDHDGGDRAKNALKVTGAIHTAVGGAVSAFTPYGAIVVAVGGVLTAIGEAISGNDDDNLGRNVLVLEHDKHWWNTTKSCDWASDDLCQYGLPFTIDNKLGHIFVRYTVDEHPASWYPPVQIL